MRYIIKKHKIFLNQNHFDCFISQKSLQNFTHSITVVGFDDTFISQHLMSSLTTVRQPIQEMAESAVSHLVNKIEHPEENWLLDESFSAELVSRDST